LKTPKHLQHLKKKRTRA